MSYQAELTEGGSLLLEVLRPDGTKWAKRIAIAAPIVDMPTSIRRAVEMLAFVYAQETSDLPPTPHEARLTGAVDLSRKRADRCHANR